MERLSVTRRPTRDHGRCEQWVQDSQVQGSARSYQEENNKLKHTVNGLEGFIKDARIKTEDDFRQCEHATGYMDDNFGDTQATLGGAHEKIRQQMEEIRGMIQENKELKAENEQLKDNENLLKKEVKLLRKELRDLDVISEMSDDDEDSSFFFFGRKNRKLQESQNKIKELHNTVHELYNDKMLMQREAAKAKFKLQQSKDLLKDQKMIIKELEKGGKNHNHGNNSCALGREEEKVKHMRKEMINLENEIRALKDAKIKEMECFHHHKCDAKSPGDNMRELEALRVQVEAFRLENERLVARIAEIHGSTSQSDIDIHLLRVEKENLQNSYAYKFNECDSLRRSIQELQQKYNDERRRMQEDSVRLEKTIRDLMSDMSCLDTSVQRLNTEKFNVANIFDGFCKQLEELQNKLDPRDGNSQPEVTCISGRPQPDVNFTIQEVDGASFYGSEFTTTTLPTIYEKPSGQRISNYDTASSDTSATYTTSESLRIKTSDTNSKQDKNRRILVLHNHSVIQPQNMLKMQELLNKITSQIDTVVNSVVVLGYEKDKIETEINILKSSYHQCYKKSSRHSDENSRLKNELLNLQQKIDELSTQNQTLQDTVRILKAGGGEAREVPAAAGSNRPCENHARTHRNPTQNEEMNPRIKGTGTFLHTESTGLFADSVFGNVNENHSTNGPIDGRHRVSRPFSRISRGPVSGSTRRTPGRVAGGALGDPTGVVPVSPATAQARAPNGRRLAEIKAKLEENGLSCCHHQREAHPTDPTHSPRGLRPQVVKERSRFRSNDGAATPSHLPEYIATNTGWTIHC